LFYIYVQIGIKVHVFFIANVGVLNLGTKIEGYLKPKVMESETKIVLG
jgi:hypothetical protein